MMKLVGRPTESFLFFPTGRGGEPQRYRLRRHRRLPEAARADQRDGGASPQTPSSFQGHRRQGVTQ